MSTFAGTIDYYRKYRPGIPSEVAEILSAAAPQRRPRRLLDVGTGTGLVVEALLTRPMSAFLSTLQGLVGRETDAVRLLREVFAAKLAFFAEEPDRARFLYAICFGPQNSSLQDEFHEFGEAMDRVTQGCAGRLAGLSGSSPPGTADFQMTVPLRLSSATSVASLPPGVQTSTLPSMSGDSE